MRLVPATPRTPGEKAALKRVGDLSVVYGHGLLAFGIGNAFVGRFDLVTGLAIVFGLAAHLAACYISYMLE